MPVTCEFGFPAQFTPWAQLPRIPTEAEPNDGGTVVKTVAPGPVMATPSLQEEPAPSLHAMKWPLRSNVTPAASVTPFCPALHVRLLASSQFDAQVVSHVVTETASARCGTNKTDTMAMAESSCRFFILFS